MTKIVFKTPAKCERKYLNSPFYKGTLMWNNLSLEQQTDAMYFNLQMCGMKCMIDIKTFGNWIV